MKLDRIVKVALRIFRMIEILAKYPLLRSIDITSTNVSFVVISNILESPRALDIREFSRIQQRLIEGYIRDEADSVRSVGSL